MTIEERPVGDVTVLTLKGRLVLDDGDDSLRERVERLIAAGRVRLLLDMAAVDYVDSAGVGVLVAKYLSVRRRGGDLRFVHLSPRVMHVMEIAHLLTIFQSFDSEQAALGSFAG
jgi:anti-sigma B factor antagonist